MRVPADGSSDREPSDSPGHRRDGGRDRQPYSLASRKAGHPLVAVGEEHNVTTTTRALELTVSLSEGVEDLASAAGVLGDGGVNVRGYTYDGDGQTPLVRFIVDEPDRARQALEDAGYEFEERPALVTAVPHEPGELSRVARRVAEREPPVASSYVVVESTSGLPQLVFTFTEQDLEEISIPHPEEV